MVLDGISESVKAVRKRAVGVFDLVGKLGQSRAVPLLLVRLSVPGQEGCLEGGRCLGRSFPTVTVRREVRCLVARGCAAGAGEVLPLEHFEDALTQPGPRVRASSPGGVGDGDLACQSGGPGVDQMPPQPDRVDLVTECLAGLKEEALVFAELRVDRDDCAIEVLQPSHGELGVVDEGG